MDSEHFDSEIQQKNTETASTENALEHPESTDGNSPARVLDAPTRSVDKLAREIEERSAEGKKAKNRKWWIQTSLLVVLIIASVVLLFGVTSLIEGEGMRSFQDVIRGIDWAAFAVLIAVVLLYMIFESSKYAYLLLTATGKFHPVIALKVMFLGKYYDGITPLGTGGQPFQIYYLHKKNSIPAGVATAVPLVKYIVTTIVHTLTAISFFCFATTFLPGGWGDTTVLIAAWVCAALNFFVPVAMVCFSLFPNFGKKAIAWIIHVLWKLKLVKHKYRVMHKYVYEMEEYRRSLKAILRKWWQFIPLALIAIIVVLLSSSVPYFVVVAIADVEPSMELLMQVLCLSLISFYASSFVPTPGSSGAFEGAGAIAFTTALATRPGMTGMIGWAILIWRLLTYYIYILAGVGINVFEIIRSAVKNRRAESRQGE